MAAVFFLIFLRDALGVLVDTQASLVGRSLSVLLLACLALGLFHFVNYIDNLMRSVLIYPEERTIPSVREELLPEVGIMIPTYNEDPTLVAACLAACRNIAYPRLAIYLLDDSSDDGFRAINRTACERVQATAISRTHRRGFKAGAINDAMATLGESVKYLLVVDADHLVKPDILADLVPLLESDPSVAFVQVPQYFFSAEQDLVAVTCSYHQHLFNKHICRGLHVNDAVVLTGSNCLFRISDLRKAGGMDESCITEDFATSFRLHMQGFRGMYVDRIYAEGVAPPTLSAYYTQQLRWAYGTTQHMGRVFRTFISSPRALTPYQWFDFMAIGTSYTLGIVNLVMLLFPSVILILDVKLVSMNLPTIFLSLFLLVMGLQFSTSIRERHYRLVDLLRSQAILNSVSLVYTQAIVFIWCGKTLTFRVTPKTIGRGDNGQSAKLMPQILAMLGAIALSICIGLSRILSGSTNTNLPYALFWACYGFSILASYIVVYRGDARKALNAAAGPIPDIAKRLDRQGIED